MLTMNLETAQRAGALRSAGLPFKFIEERVEIYVDHDKGTLKWLLNDAAAMEACGRVGEAISVEETFQELPAPRLAIRSLSLDLGAAIQSAASVWISAVSLGAA
jgi:hypothetical protein